MEQLGHIVEQRIFPWARFLAVAVSRRLLLVDRKSRNEGIAVRVPVCQSKVVLLMWCYVVPQHLTLVKNGALEDPLLVKHCRRAGLEV